jgi:hypothetical protein
MTAFTVLRHVFRSGGIDYNLCFSSRTHSPETDSVPRFEIRLLGSPDVRIDGQPIKFTRRKSLALFAYLVVIGQPHGRDSLAALFWADAAEAEARASLRHGLSTLNEYGLARWLESGRSFAVPTSLPVSRACYCCRPHG